MNGYEDRRREADQFKEYFERMLANLEQRFNQQRQYMEHAIDRLQVDTSKIQTVLKDQSDCMATKAHFETLRDRVQAIEKRIAIVAAIFSLIVSIVVGLIIRWLTMGTQGG